MDLTSMQEARQVLSALDEKLRGSESGMKPIVDHLDALQAILKTAQTPRLNFSSVTNAHLANLGIQRKCLQFDQTQLAQLLTDKHAASEDQIQQLCIRIAQIHRHVNMRYAAGTRMIIDDISFTVAEICSDDDTKLPVAILPEMNIASDDGILLTNSTTLFGMRLTGTFGYGMCTYENEDVRRERILCADVDELARLAKSQILLIEAKYLEEKTLYDFMPEAVSQAATLCEVTEVETLRFCLTDGRKWIFSVYAKGGRVFYQGNATTIPEPRLDAQRRDPAWEQSVHMIVELVYHWLVAEGNPLNDTLYELKDF
ncbi:hypothetical protein C8R45DRAFT_993836 [Mycena sanguinolenta]|nr:hypothetical protein C8R45DRAFT_993836 [Mycena sanguinolenta]